MYRQMTLRKNGLRGRDDTEATRKCGLAWNTARLFVMENGVRLATEDLQSVTLYTFLPKKGYSRCWFSLRIWNRVRRALIAKQPKIRPGPKLSALILLIGRLRLVKRDSAIHAGSGVLLPQWRTPYCKSWSLAPRSCHCNYVRGTIYWHDFNNYVKVNTSRQSETTAVTEYMGRLLAVRFVDRTILEDTHFETSFKMGVL